MKHVLGDESTFTPGLSDEDYGFGVGELKRPRARARATKSTTRNTPASVLLRKKITVMYGATAVKEWARRVTCDACGGNPALFVRDDGGPPVANCVCGSRHGAQWIPEKEMGCITTEPRSQTY